MVWQDIILTLVGIIFALALVPQVYHGFKAKSGPIKFQTSIPTGIGLFVIACVYFSLGLFFSTIISVIAGTLWLFLCVQRWKYERK